MNRNRKSAAAALVVAALATVGTACGSTPAKTDPYCPEVMHSLPGTPPQTAEAAITDINQLTSVTPQGTDRALDARVISVDFALEAVGKAQIVTYSLTPPDMSKLDAAYYASAARLRAYCGG